jgi:hypothetical protein
LVCRDAPVVDAAHSASPHQHDDQKDEAAYFYQNFAAIGTESSRLTRLFLPHGDCGHAERLPIIPDLPLPQTFSWNPFGLSGPLDSPVDVDIV